jgi:glycosyltransferase involved in cell wall biosynthesis
MTTTAYPPSVGGVQGYLSELCAGLQRFEADVLTLWLSHRTDWLLGTTVRLRQNDYDAPFPNVRALGWTRASRARMAPWVLAYYALVPIAAKRIASEMVPQLDRAVDPQAVLIHNHRIGREFLALASLVVARKRGLPFVLTPYHHPKWQGYRYSGWTRVYRAADAVLTLTEAEARELERLGVAPQRLHVIGGAGDQPMPADGARFRATIGSTGNPLVVFAGQLYRYKGVPLLVAAGDALRSRGVQVDLAFLGPETRFSRGFFANHQRPWIHVLGKVDNQTKWDALEAATVVCVPSEQESFGRVYIEAWSKGKPVVASRIPAVSEVVTDGESGLLVHPGSVEELARALERLLTDPQLAERLGANGRREVATRFNWGEVVNRVESVYESLIEAKRPA